VPVDSVGERLVWKRTTVQQRTAVYGVAGTGAPMVFLHGWGLAHRTYRHGLERLLRAGGVRVYTPALPGFGGTDDLPNSCFDLAGYARWVVDFIAAVGIDQPVTLIGHSFGGGVAIKTTHDWPERILRLILVNSIGGSVWTERAGVSRPLLERPVWDWGVHLPTDVFSARKITRVLPVIAGDALPNLLRKPRTLWRAGAIVRKADLSAELEELKRRRLPVVIVWGRGDHVLPRACLESLRAALHEPEVITVDGRHAWLIEEPDRFAEVITNVVAAPGTDAA
jgi:pimeloyl-ACP methyl ester carboxylesterase